MILSVRRKKNSPWLNVATIHIAADGMTYVVTGIKTTGSEERNKHVGPPYCQAEMYAGRIACCPLVSHVEYTSRAQSLSTRRILVTHQGAAFELRLEKDQIDRRTDGRMPVRYTCLPLDAASVKKKLS